MQSAGLSPGQALQHLFAIDARAIWGGGDTLSVEVAQTCGTLLATMLWILPLAALSPWFSRPLRALALLLMVILQLILAASLRLGAFPWVVLAGLCVLIDSSFWNAADRRSVARNKGTVTIFYDGHCAACRFGCHLLQAFLLLPDLQLHPAQDDRRAHALMQANDSWVVIDGDGSAALHWAAFALLLRRSPLFAPLGWLLGRELFTSGGNGIYRWVARNRSLLSRIGSALPSPRPPTAASPLLQRVAGVLLGLVLVWNLLALADTPPHWSLALQRPLHLLGLDLQWSLLDPKRLDTAVAEGRWRVLAGHFADGSEIDLLDPAHDRVRFVRPTAAEQLPPRWRRFIMALPAQPAAIGEDFGHYLCRRWSANGSIAGSTNERLQSIRLLALRADPQTGVAGSPRAPAEQEVVWRYDCTIGAASY
jgi:predicted DCC family thiol-disulfide oxidoreductase YuxK